MATDGKHTILVMDDDRDFLDGMRRLLLSHDYKDVVAIDTNEGILELLEQREFALFLMDWVMPGMAGKVLLSRVIERYPDMPVIIITGINDTQHVVNCIKQGAFDYITKSTDANRMMSSIDKACQFHEITRQNRQLKNYLLGEELSAPEVFSGIRTVNPHMQALFKIIETMSISNSPVMITGETGVGKELIARAIHRASGAQGEFVALNVAGLDDRMFADTLFGHKKGAFTGAHDSRQGLISKAEGGTLFLDEIGDLGTDSQVKLLRLLQEHEYYRLGSDALMKSDARIITASNADFTTLLSKSQFRRDLYHRLRNHHIHIPPLRERKEDIPLLIDHYLRTAAISMGRAVPVIAEEVRKALEEYHYPGNVRELVNLMHNAVACNDSGTLSFKDFPGIGSATGQAVEEFRIIQDQQFQIHATFPRFPSLATVEKHLIDEALRISSGNKSIAADLLDIARSTLHRKLADTDREVTKANALNLRR